MTAYAYELARRGKITCPKCGRRTFVPYVDADGAILSPEVGKCDRADNCAWHYPPKAWFADHGHQEPTKRPIRRRPKKPSFVPLQAMLASMAGLRQTHLFTFLAGRMPAMRPRLEATFRRYFTGADGLWDGSSIFWQVDSDGKVRTGKIMGYNPLTGHRVKDPQQINWYHAAYGPDGFNLVQCLYGEHLLRGNNKPVILVESEKTALVLATLCDGAIPVSCGGCGNLTEKLAAALRGKRIVVIPDNGKLDEWTRRAATLNTCESVRISTLLEAAAYDKGDDIADLLLRNTSQAAVTRILREALASTRTLR